jgi:hypothetical protein
MLLVWWLLLAVGQQPRDLPFRQAEAPRAGAVIAGRVIVAASDPAVPVRRARVTLTGGGLSSPEITDTDVHGNYRFEGLAEGAYRVTASKPGFVTMEAGASRHGALPAPILIGAAEQVAVDLQLPRGAAIDGRILDTEGEPLQNIIVSASRFTYTALGRRMTPVKQARTDDLGRYRIHSLPPGDYIVEAAPDPRADLTSGLMFAQDRPPGRGRTYYPGTPQVHLARRIALRTGQQVAQADFAVERVTLARVEGRVVDSTGKPIQATMRLQPVGGLADTPAGVMRGPGSFQFPGVPPGEYWLMASVALPGRAAEFGVQRVIASGQDVQGLTLATAPGAALEGWIVAAGNASLPRLDSVRVDPVATEFELPATRPPQPPITVGANGGFSIASLFGPRILRLTGLPEGWALVGVWLDDREITDQAFDFRAAATPRQLRLVVSDASASVRGTVRAAAEAVKAYQAVVFHKDERLRGATSRFTRLATPDAEGVFTVHGLVPGEYIAAAADHIEPGREHDPDLLRTLAVSGTAFTVSEPGTISVTLELQVMR